jgi:hypothetical protein
MGRAFRLPGDEGRSRRSRTLERLMVRWLDAGIVVRLADVQVRRMRDGMKLTRWDTTDKWMASGWDWMVVDLGRSIMLGPFHEPQMGRTDQCFLALEKQSILSPITSHKQRQNQLFRGIKKS